MRGVVPVRRPAESRMVNVVGQGKVSLDRIVDPVVDAWIEELIDGHGEYCDCEECGAAYDAIVGDSL